MLTAPARAFTRGWDLASQQAASLHLVSFPLQTCSGMVSYSFWCYVTSLSKPRSPAKKSPLFHSMLHHHIILSKNVQDLQTGILQVVFPLEEKQELERVGRERILIPNCCNSIDNSAITSPGTHGAQMYCIEVSPPRGACSPSTNHGKAATSPHGNPL